MRLSSRAICLTRYLQKKNTVVPCILCVKQLNNIQLSPQLYLLVKLNLANWLWSDKNKGLVGISSSSGNFPTKPLQHTSCQSNEELYQARVKGGRIAQKGFLVRHCGDIEWDPGMCDTSEDNSRRTALANTTIPPTNQPTKQPTNQYRIQGEKCQMQLWRKVCWLSVSLICVTSKTQEEVAMEPCNSDACIIVQRLLQKIQNTKYKTHNKCKI